MRDIADRFELGHDADAVDMPAHQVATEPVVGAQRHLLGPAAGRHQPDPDLDGIAACLDDP